MCEKQGIIIILPCSKSKQKRTSIAMKMYTGSFFRKCLKYFQEQGNEIFILSAKYGLLSLQDMIDPYELNLKNTSKQYQLDWVKKVKRQMKKKGIDKKEKIFLTPEIYSKGLSGNNPLLGLSLGKRLQWINNKLKKGFL